MCIEITLEMSKRSYQGQGSLFTWVWLWSSGYPRKSTIETSVFGAEFLAMKHGMETHQGLRYKLRMLVVPISGPSYIYGGNMSAIHNTRHSESTLREIITRFVSMLLGRVFRWGGSLTTHIPTKYNPLDLMRKFLAGQKRQNHVGNILHYIYDEHR